MRKVAQLERNAITNWFFIYYLLFLPNFILSQNSAKCNGNCENGNGTLTYSSGNVYTGSFVNSKKEGNGDFSWKASGATYSGEWKNDKMDGKGTYIGQDKKKYVGSFKDGKMNGNGVMYSSNGSVLQKGTWSNGSFLDSEKQDLAKDPRNITNDNTYILKQKLLDNVWDAKWLVGLNALSSALGSGNSPSGISNGFILSIGDDVTSVNLSGSLGYFVAKKIAVGADVSLAYAGSDGSGETSLSFHPFGKYFINKKFAVGAG
jgi:hypothetical protein